ncbi:MAG: class I SAM-dependent methyltransferase [Ruminococcus sp.]|nr:class I SAM-dependent methyltransferase [Ruminococcus sp.]
MFKLSEYIGRQCGNPHGIIGKICCLIMNIINNMMYKNIISDINSDKNIRILDIGCGNGFFIRQLYRNTKAHIYGIDISEDMINTTARLNRKAITEGHLKLRAGNCCNLPYNDKTFDVVTSINSIYFWDDTLKGLSEIKRVLRNDGVFYNAVYSKKFLKKLPYTRKCFKLFRKSDYITLGKKAGFSSVELKEIVAGESYIIKYIK